MPNKHFYFALGAAHGALAVWAVRKSRHWLFERAAWMRSLYRWDRDWFLYFPGLVGLVGLWGLVPDFLHASGLVAKEITRSAGFNIFFFHSFFERIEDAYPRVDWLLNLTGSALLFLLALGMLCFYAKEAKRLYKC